MLELQLKGGLTQVQMGEKLGRTAAQIKTDLHRARQRLARLIKAEVAHYASSKNEYDDEVAALLARLGSR